MQICTPFITEKSKYVVYSDSVLLGAGTKVGSVLDV